MLYNSDTAVITGGVYIQDAAATVINAGTITGSGGTAVAFGGTGGGNFLSVAPGAVFNGNVLAPGSANLLGLASAASAGAISGIGTKFTVSRHSRQTPAQPGPYPAPSRVEGPSTIGAGSDLIFDGGVSSFGPTSTLPPTPAHSALAIPPPLARPCSASRLNRRLRLHLDPAKAASPQP